MIAIYPTQVLATYVDDAAEGIAVSLARITNGYSVSVHDFDAETGDYNGSVGTIVYPDLLAADTAAFALLKAQVSR